jgi:putative hemolysin
MIGLEILVVGALILVNGFLAMSELAIVSVRRSRLQSLLRRGARGAKGASAALRLREDPTRFLSTVQVGITLVGIVAGAFGGATLSGPLAGWLDRGALPSEYAEPLAFGLIVVAITYVSLIFGELVPKRIALSHPAGIAAAVGPAMERLARIAGPVGWLLQASTEAVLRPFGLTGRPDSTVTEDEVRALIAEGTRVGVFLRNEQEMIEGVLRLADRKVSALMTPRHEVVWIDEHAPAADIAEQLTGQRFSRFPVCSGTLDEPVGIVHTKDLVREALRGRPFELTRAMLPALVVPEGLRALKLLDMFRRERLHMAIVVDEYGSTQGVVTLADILQSITGGLPELGEDSPPGIARREDGSWLVDGALPVDVFEYQMGIQGLRADGDFETMAGFVLHRFGHLPAAGEHFEAFGGRFEVVDMDGWRVDAILFTPDKR